jgi:hypothetical protein
VIWRELSKRGIGFDTIVSGNPISSITKSMSHDYRYPTLMETIVYTNSKTAVMGSLTKALENVLENVKNCGVRKVPMISFRGT